jgi:hypothetical protein
MKQKNPRNITSIRLVGLAILRWKIGTYLSLITPVTQTVPIAIKQLPSIIWELAVPAIATPKIGTIMISITLG